MRILDVAFKDLFQIFRDKLALLLLVAMPIGFTLFMGFAYQSGSEKPEADQRLSLGWVNQDPAGAISGELFTMLSSSETIKLVELEPDEADGSVRRGEVAGALVVPQGFSEQVFTNKAQITLITDSASATGQSLYQLLRAVITRLMSAVEIGKIGADLVGKPKEQTEVNAGFMAALQAWSKADSAALIKLERATGKEEQAWYGDTPYNQASPGILVQFAIFGLTTSGQILVQERKTRTLQRMLTTSLRPWQIIAGHLLGMFGVVLVQVILLILFGQLLLGVNYAREPLGVLLISLGLGLWIAAMGLFIGTVAKDDSQVVVYSLMAMFIFSSLGGTWFPIEATSGAFAAVSRLLPASWAMTGYQNILLRGLDLSSSILPFLILLAYALGFFILAVWRFRKHLSE